VCLNTRLTICLPGSMTKNVSSSLPPFNDFEANIAEKGFYFTIHAGDRLSGDASMPGQIVFSDMAPYMEMGWYDNGNWHQTWKAM